MDKINVALIGVGYWGPNIFRTLKSLKSCKLKTIIETDVKRQKYIKKIDAKLKVSSDLSVVLNDNDIKAVIISTPPKTHYRIALKCLKARKNLLIEKPIVSNTKEYRKLLSIAKKNKLILMAGDLYLFNAAILKIKKLIKSNYLGKIIYFNSQRKNLGRIRNDIDVNWSLGTHDISIIQYLMDYQTPMRCIKNNFSFLQEKISDVSKITLKFKNNITALISVSWLHPEKIRELIIVGTKRMLIYNDLKPEEVKVINKSVIPIHSFKGKNLDYDKKFLKFNNQVKKSKILKVKKSQPLKNEINHFFMCIKNKKIKCLTGEKHSLNILNIMKKIN